MMDSLLVVFWAAAYFLMIVYSIMFRKEKKAFMPLISGALNFGWEINAVIFAGGAVGHVIWTALDLVILGYNTWLLRERKRQVCYLICVAALLAGLYGLFHVGAFDGMLIASFVIDLIMAAEYVLAARRLSPHGQLLIGSLRLLGDLCAWVANLKSSKAVLLMGSAVLFLNILYLCVCYEDRFQQKNGK